jgi:hypothetical protein
VTFLKSRWRLVKNLGRGGVRRRQAAQPQPQALLAVDERHGVGAVPGQELLAARVGLGAHLEDHVVPDRDPGAGRQVVVRHVEVDVELISGQGPALVGVGEQRGHPRAHHGDHRVEVATLRDGLRGRPRQPVVPDEPGRLVDHALLEDLARGVRGAPDDQGQRARLARRGTQVVEVSGQVGECGEGRHSPDPAKPDRVRARPFRADPQRTQ